MERQARASPPPVTLVNFSQRGVFQLSNEDYFIEPLDGVSAQPGHAQPHVVYKHQGSRKQAQQGDSRPSGTCGMQGMYPPAELCLGTTWRLMSFLETSLNTLMPSSLGLEQCFSTYGSRPLGRLNDPFTGVAYQIACISDIYIMIHNSSKNCYKVATEIILWLGVTTHEELY